MSLTLSDAIAADIARRKQDKLLSLEKERNQAIAANEEKAVQQLILGDYYLNVEKIEQQFSASVWLTQKAQDASKLSVATHVAKYTHGDSKSSSVFMTTESSNHHYLITTKLPEPVIDFALSSAVYSDIAGLLKITVNNENLITQLKQGHIDALKPFTEDETLLQQWQNSFLKVLSINDPKSHYLSKQVYFPIEHTANQTNYHLLCPLFSSTLAQALYASVQSTRFSELSKAVRIARKNKQFHPLREQRFPNTAVQKFGGTNPQNISPLNSQRNGQSYLLDCAPPNYKPQVSLPIQVTTIFNRRFTKNTQRLTLEFKRFLEWINREKNNLETDTPVKRNLARYKKREDNFLLSIIEQLLLYAASIQQMVQFKGWSQQAHRLKRHYKLWLDSAYPESDFQQQRAEFEWLEMIADDFAAWLKQQLKSKVYRLSDIDYQHFKKVCLSELKKFERRQRLIKEQWSE